MENEIIQSLLAEKTKLEQEFSELDAQARNIEIGKERIRGAYIVIVDQLKKFGVIKDEATTSNTSETETPKEEVKQKTTKKSTEKKVEQPKESKKEKVMGLTPEEIEKINKAVTKSDMKDENGNDIPEYLQSEYNK